MPDYSLQRLASFGLMYGGVFWGAWIWIQNPRNVEISAHILLVGIIVGVAASLYFVTLDGAFLPSDRVTGAFGKATATGSFAALSLPLVLWKIWYSRGKTRLALAFVLITLFYLLIFSGARAAIVGGLSATALWSWKHLPRLRPAFGLAGCAFVGLVATNLLTLDMLPKYVVRKESLSTFTGRIPLWKAGLEIFYTSPVIGRGYGICRYGTLVMNESAIEHLAPSGTEEHSRVAYLRRAVTTRRPAVMTFHSDHVERLAETGILGYSAFGAMWFFLGRRFVALLREPRDRWRSLGIALGLNVLYVFINSFMHGAMFAIGNPSATGQWFVIALFMAATESRRGYTGVSPCPTQYQLA